MEHWHQIQWAWQRDVPRRTTILRAEYHNRSRPRTPNLLNFDSPESLTPLNLAYPSTLMPLHPDAPRLLCPGILYPILLYLPLQLRWQQQGTTSRRSFACVSQSSTTRSQASQSTPSAQQPCIPTDLARNAACRRISTPAVISRWPTDVESLILCPAEPSLSLSVSVAAVLQNHM